MIQVKALLQGVEEEQLRVRVPVPFAGMTALDSHVHPTMSFPRKRESTSSRKGASGLAEEASQEKLGIGLDEFFLGHRPAEFIPLVEPIDHAQQRESGQARRDHGH